ncbi:MAG: aryl-sulfate sulfotransferase [Clostridiaceae bacterium]|nr:aryl-sulfate sulfotransferase [Clostridiaceae bacterium]
MGFLKNYFVEVKNGTKVTYSEGDLRKLDRTYENEVLYSRESRVKTPIRKISHRAYISQVRDYAFEKILDKHIYTFQHLLVVPNPYGLVKQSALILFNSSQETKVRYRVYGDTPDADFTGETEYNTRHRVPVMGLYFGRSNKVLLEMLDRDEMVIRRREIRIYVSEMPVRIENVISSAESKKMPYFSFIMVNGLTFNPFAFDCNMAIRYSIQLRTSKIGMIPLNGGHFLYEDSTVSQMDSKGRAVSCCYHEMDYMGRVYRTFLLDFPIKEIVAQQGDSLFIVTSSDGEHAADSIAELDRNSGKVKKRCNISSLFGNKYKNKTNWADITALSCQGDSLLVTLKRLHTIFRMNWRLQKLEWILAPDSVWKGTEAEQYVIRGNVRNHAVCRRPDFAYMEGEPDASAEKLLVYHQKSEGDIKLGNVKPCRKSAVVCVRIDKKTHFYKKVFAIACAKTKRFGSAILTKDGKHVLIGAGYLKYINERMRSCLTVVDTETAETEFELPLQKFFNKMWVFEPDILQFTKQIDTRQNAVYGALKTPERFHGELPQEAQERIEKEYFSNIRICDELVLYNILPGRVDRVYFIGKENAYLQDYTGMKPKKHKASMACSLSGFAVDEYHIMVESRGVVHRLKNEIRIVKGQDMS